MCFLLFLCSLLLATSLVTSTPDAAPSSPLTKLLADLNKLNCPAVGLTGKNYCPDPSYSFKHIPDDSPVFSIRMWNFDVTKSCPSGCLKHALIDPEQSGLRTEIMSKEEFLTGAFTQAPFTSVAEYYSKFYSLDLGDTEDEDGSGFTFWNGITDFVDPFKFYQSEMEPYESSQHVNLRAGFMEYHLQRSYVANPSQVKLLPYVNQYLESVLGDNYDPDAIASVIDIIGTHIPTECYVGAIAYTRTAESGCIAMNLDMGKVVSSWSDWMKYFVQNSGKGTPPGSASYFKLAQGTVRELRGGDPSVASWPDRISQSVPKVPVLTKCTGAVPVYTAFDNPKIAANFKRFLEEEYLKDAQRARNDGIREVDADLEEKSISRGVGAGIFMAGDRAEGPLGSIAYYDPGQGGAWTWSSHGSEISLSIERDTGIGIRTSKDSQWVTTPTNPRHIATMDSSYKNCHRCWLFFHCCGSRHYLHTQFYAVYHCPTIEWTGPSAKCVCTDIKK